VTYLALASLGLVALCIASSAGLLRWLVRSHTRESQAWALERAALIDRVCHLSGNPWTPPPLRSVPNGEPAEHVPVFIDVDNEPEY
jgi:hypothetical protein